MKNNIQRDLCKMTQMGTTKENAANEETAIGKQYIDIIGPSRKKERAVQ